MTVTGSHFTIIRMSIESWRIKSTAYHKMNAGTSAPIEDRDMKFSHA